LVVNALLETNYIKGIPSNLINLDSVEASGPVIDLTQVPGFPIDSKRVVEGCVVEHSEAIIKMLLRSLKAPPDDFYGDVLSGCLQMLTNLVNTNHPATHQRLLLALRCRETSVEKLFQAFFDNPTCSIYAIGLESFISYILYASIPETSPIAEHILKIVNLLKIVRTEYKTAKELTPRMKQVAKRAMLMRLSQRIVRCQHGMPAIKEIMRALPDYEEWAEFVETTVRLFTEKNRPQKTPSMTTRSSTVVEVDEVKDKTLIVDKVTDFHVPVHVELSTEHIAEQMENSPAEKIDEQAEDGPAEKIDEQIEDSPAEHIAEQVENSLTEHIAEQIEDSPAEKIDEQAEDNPTEKIDEQAEDGLTKHIAEQMENSPAEKIDEQAEDGLTEHIAEQMENSPAEKIDEQIEDSPAEKIDEQAENSLA